MIYGERLVKPEDLPSGWICISRTGVPGEGGINLSEDVIIRLSPMDDELAGPMISVPVSELESVLKGIAFAHQYFTGEGKTIEQARAEIEEALAEEQPEIPPPPVRRPRNIPPPDEEPDSGSGRPPQEPLPEDDIPF